MTPTITRRHLLFYDYVEDVLEKRAPHREAHLALIDEWKSDGRVLMAGAVGDPPHGAVFVFASDEAQDAEAFADADPYVANGVVTRTRVEPWNVVG